jgi:hypothetical protein
MLNKCESQVMHIKFWSQNVKGKRDNFDIWKLSDDIKTDLKEVGWEDVNWIHLPQDWVQ